MVRKAFLLFLMFLATVSSVWCATIGYVYGNQVSSVDFDVPPKVGTVFKDSKNNVLIVAKSLEKAVVFDRISTSSPVEEGSALTYKGRDHSIFARVSLANALVGYSVSTALHPVRPVVSAGFTYSTKRLFVSAGFEADVILSNLWDSSFTFIEDGGVLGWCTLGAFVLPSVAFACSYGVAYRHYIGSFRWELGVSWLRGTGSILYKTPYIGLGVSI